MKKQQKTKKSRSLKSAAQPARVVVVHNKWQRFWGIVALAGLFLCGLFVGMAISKPSEEDVQNIEVPQPIEEVVEIAQPQDVCAEVERLLLRHLVDANDNVDNRISRAKIYASVAERGCPENSESYVELAKQELDIARAIDDDEFNHQETIDVVETYKRLNMQAAAEEIFEKAKKLTDPTIDFIIQVEKIINE